MVVEQKLERLEIKKKQLRLGIHAHQKKEAKQMGKQLPAKWVLGWSGDIELGFDDGKYLPRKPALILYPEYFDEQGNPIKDKLPFDKPKERRDT